MIVLGFKDYEKQGRALAVELGAPFEVIDVHHFPDGECRIRIPVNLPKEAIICQTLHEPNEKLIQILLAAHTARENGVQILHLVAPYLCYMRQDMAFHPGEAVSQKIIGDFLAGLFDGVITVDAHLHRVTRLSQAIPLQHAESVSAAGPIGQFMAGKVSNPVFIGPDSESEQWVKIAARDQFDYVVGEKQRRGDYDVSIHLPTFEYKNRHTVIIDDIAGTGRTLLETVKTLKAYEPASISICVTHALFVNDAYAKLQQAEINNIFSTDSVAHASNAIPLAPLLAKEVYTST